MQQRTFFEARKEINIWAEISSFLISFDAKIDKGDWLSTSSNPFTIWSIIFWSELLVFLLISLSDIRLGFNIIEKWQCATIQIQMVLRVVRVYFSFLFNALFPNIFEHRNAIYKSVSPLIIGRQTEENREREGERVLNHAFNGLGCALCAWESAESLKTNVSHNRFQLVLKSFQCSFSLSQPVTSNRTCARVHLYVRMRLLFFEMLFRAVSFVSFVGPILFVFYLSTGIAFRRI